MRIKILLYATIFNVLAGAVTGSIFKFQLLLLVLIVVIFESILLAIGQGSIGVAWAFANIVGVEVGYFICICVRTGLEHAGYLQSSNQMRRSP
jgi:hypothetical protein